MNLRGAGSNETCISQHGRGTCYVGPFAGGHACGSESVATDERTYIRVPFPRQCLKKCKVKADQKLSQFSTL